MLFWWLVVGILVAAASLLGLLLIPLPARLHRAVIEVIERLKKPLWIVLAGMVWVFFDSTIDMRKYHEKPIPDNAFDKMLMYQNKWRSERNFYLVAFAFTLLLILVRMQSVAYAGHQLEEETRHLRALRNINDGPHTPIRTKKAD